MLCYYIYIDIYFLKRYIKQKYAELEPYWYNRYIRWYQGDILGSYNIVEIGEDEDRLFKYIKNYGYKRIWLVYSSWKRDGILEPYEKTVREWMQGHYLILDKKEFDGIFVDLYTNKIR